MTGGGGRMPGGGARRSASWQFAERHLDGLVVAAAADRQGDLVAGRRCRRSRSPPPRPGPPGWHAGSFSSVALSSIARPAAGCVPGWPARPVSASRALCRRG